jgi:hypothetical protein
MCEAHAAAGHETAAEALASERTAHSMSAEAAPTTEAAARMAAEAASPVATATTTTATTTAARFGNASRGSDGDRRSKCSFDCKCREIHLCTHRSEEAPVNQSCFARLVPLCPKAPQGNWAICGNGEQLRKLAKHYSHYLCWPQQSDSSKSGRAPALQLLQQGCEPSRLVVYARNRLTSGARLA